MEIEVEKPLIYQLLEQGRKDELEEKLESWLPDELAELCNDLNAQEQAVIFSVIDRDRPRIDRKANLGIGACIQGLLADYLAHVHELQQVHGLCLVHDRDPAGGIRLF